MEQLDEVARIVASPEWKERIFPFICVDPRRPDIAEIVKDYIENKGFCGVKLYPALGYYPQDERLDELWDWIEQKKIPVMVHCSKDGAVYNKRWERNIAIVSQILLIFCRYWRNILM